MINALFDDSLIWSYFALMVLTNYQRSKHGEAQNWGNFAFKNCYCHFCHAFEITWLVWCTPQWTNQWVSFIKHICKSEIVDCCSISLKAKLITTFWIITFKLFGILREIFPMVSHLAKNYFLFKARAPWIQLGFGVNIFILWLYVSVAAFQIKQWCVGGLKRGLQVFYQVTNVSTESLL